MMAGGSTQVRRSALGVHVRRAAVRGLLSSASPGSCASRIFPGRHRQLREFTITDQQTDQTPRGKGSNLLVGTAAQVTGNLKRLKEAGLNLLLLWPPSRTCRSPRPWMTSSG